MFNLQFPCKKEILGLENSSMEFRNEFGEYFFKLDQTKDNQLKFISSYKILKDFIPNEALKELKLLNEKVRNVKNKRLIVKLKK